MSEPNDVVEVRICKCGVASVFPGHVGMATFPFTLTRISTNEATRYGTFSVDETSCDGDTANTDAMLTADGHYGDILCIPPAGNALVKVCKSAEAIEERTR